MSTSNTNDSTEVMLSSSVTNLTFTSFENAKKNIQEFANKNASEFGISSVPSSGGLFGLGNHKVTGDELNNVTSQVQGHLMKINGATTDVIKEFGQVYTALESLDKEYIPAILSAVKGAELASNKAKSAAEHAKVAQEDIKKTVEEQKKIIKILENHKAKLERLKHLESVDDIWKASRDLEKETAIFKNNLEEAKTQLSRIDGNIKALQRFADGILDYEHLDDIDDIWDRIGLAEEVLTRAEEKIETAENSIESNRSSIEELLSYINALKELEHLQDVDAIWNGVQSANEEILQISVRQNTDAKIIEDHSTEIKKLNQNLGSICSEVKRLGLVQISMQEFDSKLNQQKHLFDIDELWNQEEKTSEELSDAIRKIENTNDKVENLSEIQVGIQAFEARMEEQKQLYNIDGIYEKLQCTIEETSILKQKVLEKEEELTLVAEELKEEKELHKEELRNLKKQVYISYGVGGFASVVGLLALILNIFGVI